MIKTENVSFSYSDGEQVLKNINLAIEKGSFAAIIGCNGSGKSTAAKHFNALLLPKSGAVYVKGIDTRDEKRLFEIRSAAGMVFQNPDNQMVAAIVEDEVAFAPENLGLERNEIRRRVDESLRAVGMEEYALKSSAHLSGGQKQRVAVAAALAMEPECLILDESTAMLDPRGRAELMKTIKKLNRGNNLTVILITHYMDEAAQADRVIVMDGGEIVMDGTPRAVFSDVEKIRSLGLDVPQAAEIAYELGLNGALTVDECVNAIDGLLGGARR